MQRWPWALLSQPRRLSAYICDCRNRKSMLRMMLGTFTVLLVAVLITPIGSANIQDPIVAATCQALVSACDANSFSNDNAHSVLNCACGPGLCPSPPYSEGFAEYTFLPAPACPAGTKLFHNEQRIATGGRNLVGVTEYSCWECCALPPDISTQGQCRSDKEEQDVTHGGGFSRPADASTTDPPPAAASAAPPAAPSGSSSGARSPPAGARTPSPMTPAPGGGPPGTASASTSQRASPPSSLAPAATATSSAPSAASASQTSASGSAPATSGSANGHVIVWDALVAMMSGAAVIMIV